MRVTRILAVLAVVLRSTVAAGDVDSGPKVGTEVGALNVSVVTGDQAGQELDYAAHRRGKPTIYLFIPHEKFDRPIARFLKQLEQSVKEGGQETQLVTIFLTDDAAKTKEYLPKAQMSLQFTINPLVVFPSARMSPEGWAVNTDAHLTAVIVRSGTVTARFGYRSVNETAVPEVIEALKKGDAK